MIDRGRVAVVQVTTTEKVARRVRLVVHGTSGHASIPRIDNALVHLSAAVAKLGMWETPIRLNETTRTYFEKLALISTSDSAARYRGLFDPAGSGTVARYLAEHEPDRHTMLRTSVVPTILKAGFRMNVIPSEAEATIDVRALPDEDMTAFHQEMRRVIADPAVMIEPLAGARPVAPASRLDTEMYRALERVGAQMYPGSTTLPTMLGGGTDMAQLRAKGIQSYGIGPASTDDDALRFGAHSDVERLSESSLYGLVEFTWRAIVEVAARR
jgi:acetylornithine deacetylase/succinyl-diaminopimelate desuccinylase-like protein